MQKSILIIDDEKSIRKILEIALEDDYRVILADSGDLGIELASKESPDLILLDHMMPGKDGVATLKELRQNESTKKVPIIFLTARVQTQEMDEYSRLDVLGVLRKPFDPMTLGDQIEELLEKGNGDAPEKSAG